MGFVPMPLTDYPFANHTDNVSVQLGYGTDILERNQSYFKE
jgi:hypothetical protein